MEYSFSRLLVTDVLSIISSLPRVFSLYARVGWCDVCAEFTNLIKVDVAVAVNEMSLSPFISLAARALKKCRGKHET